MDNANNKIALYLQEDGSLVSFYNADMVVVYEKNEQWDGVRKIPVERKVGTGCSELRAEIRRIIGQLQDCRIIAGQGLSGVAFQEFDRAGFHIFDVSQNSAEELDGILDDLKSSSGQSRQGLGPQETRPLETDTPGIYRFNLALAQTENPELSSKKLLQDFLQSIPFLELHLICRHLPPWLEAGPFQAQSRTLPDSTVYAVITKKK